MTETKTIEIPVYRDSKGNPVCGECKFLRIQFSLACRFDANKPHYWNEGEKPTPHNNCPLWQGEGQ